MKSLIEHYREARKPRFSPSWARGGAQMYVSGAKSALQQARHALMADVALAAFKAAGGEFLDEYEFERVSDDCPLCIVCRADETGQGVDDLLGDGFDVEYLVNKEHWPRHIAKREREEAIERLNRDGVWGYTTHYRDANGEWQQGEWSCWGFVGDDFKGSGYDCDALRTVLKEWQDAQAEAAGLNQFATELCNA